MLKLGIGVLFVALTYPSAVSAQPAISGVSGALAHGQTLTISGSGFGSRATAAPYLYDHFTNGFSSKWSGTGPDSSILTASLRGVFSTRYIENDFDGENGGHLTIDESQSGTNRVWYQSYWFYLHSDWTWGTCTDPGSACGNLANIKILRLWGTNDPGDDSAMLQIHGWDNELVRSRCGGNDVTSIANVRSVMTLGTWHRLESEFTDSSSAGASDGSWRVYLDGVKYTDESGQNYKCGSNTGKRPYDNAFWNSWQVGSGPNTYRQTDNVVDKFIQRVEACPGSTWATRGKCEYQGASSWSDQNIAVSFYQGALSTSSPVYLYVVNAQGVANSNGFRVSGGGQTIPAPAQVTNVRVIR